MICKFRAYNNMIGHIFSITFHKLYCLYCIKVACRRVHIRYMSSQRAPPRLDLALSGLNDLIALDTHRVNDDVTYNKAKYYRAVRYVVKRERRERRDPSIYFDYLGSKLYCVDPETMVEANATRAEADFHFSKLSFRSMAELYKAWLSSCYYYDKISGRKRKRTNRQNQNTKKAARSGKRRRRAGTDFS